MPLGAEGFALVAMGWGIDQVTATADAVAGWPGASSLAPAMPPLGLGLVTLGGLWLLLWRRRWRLAGLPLIIGGLATAFFVTPPDVLVADDGRLMAVRDSEGRLLLSSTRVNTYEAEEWLQSAAEDQAVAWPAEGYGAGGRLACDSLGCLYRLHGRTIALVRHPAALPEDCQVAHVVVSAVPVRRSCSVERVIDRFDLWRLGAHALWIAPDGTIRVRSVNEVRGDRPWVVRPDRKVP
jgi:competence protein ComEC